MLWSIISTCSINQWCFSYYNFLKNILYQYNYNFKLQFQRRWYEKYIRQKNFLACIFLDCLPKWSIRRLPLGRIFLGTLQANLTLFWITIKQFWFILVVNMQQLQILIINNSTSVVQVLSIYHLNNSSSNKG